jgi:transcriptional regulator with XRE-family HTH domain
MFGKRLKELRMEAGMTQEALARAADVSNGTVAKLEHVEGMDPSWSTVQKLAKALGVEVTAFLQEPEPEPARERPKGKSKDKKGGSK